MKPRPSAMLSSEQLESLRRIDSPTIANAIEAFKLRDPTVGYASMELRCMFPDLPPVVGYAVTCTADSVTPGVNLPSEDEALDKAIRDAPKPAIVVIQDIGPNRLRSCHAGDVMASLCQSLGAVALVTDGGVRDLKGVRERVPSFQIFAAGEVVAHGIPRIVAVGVTVSIFGMTVLPGDLLHGDANGLTSVPLSIADKVPEEAERVWQREREIVAYLQGPHFTLEGMFERFGFW